MPTLYYAISINAVAYNRPIGLRYSISLQLELYATRNAWQSLACSPRGIAVAPLANR